MHNILAIETTSQYCAVALCCSQRSAVIFEAKSQTSNSHANEVLSLIQTVLNDANCAMKELECIALSVGPGSFTGIRIGLSVAQGLAYGLGIPVIAINTLELMAYKVGLSHSDELNAGSLMVHAALDARMGDVYYQSFVCAARDCKEMPDISIAPTLPTPMLVKLDSLSTETLSNSGDYRLAGDGWALDGRAKSHDESWCDESLLPSQAIIGLAKIKIEQGDMQSASQVAPLYVRNEVLWKKRQRIRESNT